MSKLQERLSEIQRTLKAPKNLRNTFGNYNYRNAEGILEALKPHLTDGLVLVMSAEPIILSGANEDRFYIKVTGTLKLNDESIVVTAVAREASEKKGMDSSQLSGACESYAAKYMLGKMFLLDDSKDADSDEFQGDKKEKGLSKSSDKEQSAEQGEGSTGGATRGRRGRRPNNSSGDDTKRFDQVAQDNQQLEPAKEEVNTPEPVQQEQQQSRSSFRRPRRG